MPLNHFNYPIFSLAKIFLRPFVNSLVYNSSLYKALWSFSSYTILNVGFVNGILILFNIRRYVYGIINLTSLSNLIFNINPIVWGIYETVLKSELNKIRLK